MFDLKILDKDTDQLITALTNRGVKEAKAEVARISKVRTRHKMYQRAIEQGRYELKMMTERYAKAQKDKKTTARQLASIRARCGNLKERVRAAEERINDYGHFYTGLLALPNIPDKSVPVGADETGNLIVATWGQPVDYREALDHVELGTNLRLMDFTQTAKISGTRHVTLKGALAKLERVLGHYMLEHNISRGFREHAVPLLVNENAMIGTGQLPKFKDESYRTGHKYLIPTSEVSLTNLYRESILPNLDKPERLTALTPCFRSEAGSAGRDTHGLIRQHQFNKVELVSICHPDKSNAEHEYLCETAELILQALELPYRKVLLCTGDMGFSSKKTFDLEVWIPSQKTYREISSISNCGDFQARRMEARVKNPTGKGTFYPHTLNGSSLAVGRTLVAVLENYQQEDSSIVIPTVLQGLMGGTVIRADGKVR